MSKHTPGPWNVLWDQPDLHDDDTLVAGLAGNGATVCNLGKRPTSEDGCEEETFDANARLVAAAPDLLEACKTLACYRRTLAVELGWPVVERLFAAIDKAEGRGR